MGGPARQRSGCVFPRVDESAVFLKAPALLWRDKTPERTPRPVRGGCGCREQPRRRGTSAVTTTAPARTAQAPDVAAVTSVLRPSRRSRARRVPQSTPARRGGSESFDEVRPAGRWRRSRSCFDGRHQASGRSQQVRHAGRVGVHLPVSPFEAGGQLLRLLEKLGELATGAIAGQPASLGAGRVEFVPVPAPPERMVVFIEHAPRLLQGASSSRSDRLSASRRSSTDRSSRSEVSTSNFTGWSDLVLPFEDVRRVFGPSGRSTGSRPLSPSFVAGSAEFRPHVTAVGGSSAGTAPRPPPRRRSLGLAAPRTPRSMPAPGHRDIDALGVGGPVQEQERASTVGPWLGVAGLGVGELHVLSPSRRAGGPGRFGRPQ